MHITLTIYFFSTKIKPYLLIIFKQLVMHMHTYLKKAVGIGTCKSYVVLNPPTISEKAPLAHKAREITWKHFRNHENAGTMFCMCKIVLIFRDVCLVFR